MSEGVYIGGEIEEILGQESARMFVFYGFCVWRPKQLDGEVRSSLWRVEGMVETAGLFERSDNAV